MVAAQTSLVNAMVLLRCADPRHKCEKLRDKLVEMEGITEAYITNTQILNIRYCVGGTIVTTPENLAKLEKRLLAMSNSKRNRTIDKVAVVVGAD